MTQDLDAIAALLPEDFVLGVATAAFQIEGATAEDGRGPSVWDAFTARPGTILDGSDARVADDHYHRVEEDVGLLGELGADAYRFSISWPRVQPTGSGPPNPRGLAFYDRLVDRLLAAGIRPMATLFHWDTPQALEERGGWRRRDTALRFAEYAAIVGERLGDRVADWVTLNEPATVVLEGYVLGEHAPGRSDLFGAFRVARNLLLGHGLAARALRSVPVAGRIGITNVHSPMSAASESADDRAMAALLDLVQNRLFGDPVLLGRLPSIPRGTPAAVRLALWARLRWRRRDLRTIAQPLDFYALNYYFPSRVAAGPDPGTAARVPLHLAPEPDLPRTGFGWPVSADGLRTLLEQLATRYGAALPPVVITENGASYPDTVTTDADGRPRVRDAERTRYLAEHLAVVADAAGGGVPGVDLRAYYVWTLLDNFEWAAGYTQRFGIVHVDRDTLQRTPKDSFHWLRALQAARGRPR